MATLSLLNSDESANLIQRRLASRKWWFFVIVNLAGHNFIRNIEAAHYRGRASRDFEVLTFPLVAGIGSITVFMAHKRRLSRRQLIRHFDGAGMIHESERLAKSSGRDVIILVHPDASVEVQNWLLEISEGENS